MKSTFFTIQSFLISGFLLVGQTPSLMAADPEPVKAKAPSGVYGDIVIDENLKKMLDVPGVKEVYVECQKEKKALEKMPDCIWGKLSADKKKKVQEVYAKEIKPKVDAAARAPASGVKDSGTTELSLTARENNLGVDYASDPAVQALSKHYGEQLDKILKPENSDVAANKIVTVDHSKFSELYKTELGKTIINAFTSYCIDTSPTTCCRETDQQKDQECMRKTCEINEDTKKKDREANIKSLTGADLNTNSLVAKKWTKCITDVPKACYSGTNKTSESSRRACLIVDYVKAARKNILIVDEQKVFYDSIKADKNIQIADNMKIVDGEAASADAILQMTSTDVKDKLKDSTDAMVKESEACLGPDGKTITNIAQCKKFLSLNKDANEDAVTDFGLRQLAQEDTLEEELKSDKRVKDYLKEEGFAQEQIDKLTADEESLDKTRQEILDRYKAEKRAIIADMAKKVTDKTVGSEDGKIMQTQTDVSKLQAIKDQLKNRGEEIASLIKFNNIVSSYLAIDEGNGKQSRNTASLFAEAKGMEEKEKAQYEQKMNEAGLVDNKSSANLSVETLNQFFLEYKKADEAKAAKKNGQ